MSIVIKTTNEAVSEGGVNILIYGASGVGKTRLVATAPNPLLISAESNIMSLADYSVPVIEVNKLADIIEVYKFLATSKEAAVYETVCLDSITEIAEIVFSTVSKTEKDKRAAYGDTGEKVRDLIRDFRDLSRFNTYFSAKMDYVSDEVGRRFYAPMMPGKKLGFALPYFFNEVFKLDIGVDDNTKESFRYLATEATPTYIAKDASGKLDPVETPDLTHIINKAKGLY